MATLAKIRENLLGVFLGVLAAGIVVFLLDPTYSDCIDLIRALPQLTTCVFGFLLTLLGIVLQGESPLIAKMRDSKVVYNRFINYNKKVVVLSFVLTIVALIMGYVSYSWLNGLLLKFCQSTPILVRKFALFILTFGAVWLVVDLMTFVKLFYLLIKESK